MRRPRKLHWVLGAAVLLGLIVIVVALRPSKRPQFATATVERGTVEDAVLATGTLQPVRLVSVGAQVSGRVESLKVGLGDHVAKGQVIATIDPIPAANQLKTAQAGLAQTVAQRAAQAASLAQDIIVLKREATTLAAQASSQADYDSALAAERAAKANLDALDAQIAQARVAVDSARLNLGYTNVVAPIDGDVLAVVTKQGQTVNAVQAAPTIVVLGDMSTMIVKAQISEADVVRVHPGQPVYFTVLGDAQRRFRGKLSSVAPAPSSIVNEVSGAATTAPTSTTATAVYYDGLVDVPNADRELKADMTAQVTILVAQATDVVTIPSAALDQRDSAAGFRQATPPRLARNQHLVLVLDSQGRPHPRIVTVGLDNKVTTQVLSGLDPGEVVVVGQANALTEATAMRRGPLASPGA